MTVNADSLQLLLFVLNHHEQQWNNNIYFNQYYEANILVMAITNGVQQGLKKIMNITL